MTRPSAKTAAVLAAAVAVAGLGTAAWFTLVPGGDDRFAPCRTTQVAGGAASIGGPFTLTDQTGARVTEVDVITGPTLVYFGYTYCPDVCPFDTARTAEAVDILAERGIAVKPVFITIDPARDTPDAMAEYTRWIHPDMVGLTGSQPDIDAAVRAYRVYAKKAGEGEDYLMDHSTFTYLMAPGAGMLDFFRRDMTPEAMADAVACFVERLD